MSHPGLPRALVGDWFGEHYPQLVRFLARRAGARGTQIEDLAQEAFLRLLRVERAELIRHPRAYLYQVATNVLLEWRLRASERQPHSSEPLDGLVTEESAEEAAGVEQMARLVRQELQALPAMCQAVLMLRAQSEFDNQQIAERLGISRRMVKRHLELGYALLRTRLSRLKL